MAYLISPAQRIAVVLAAIFCVVAGRLHFIKPGPYLKIVPPYVPWHGARVRVSGASEIFGGLGLLVAETRKAASWGLIALLWALVLQLPIVSWAQGGHPIPPPPPPGVKTIQCHDRPIPQLEDVTQKAGIHFSHISTPEQKYILDSMSGGVLLLDYDRDGWLDIYFTGAPTVEMALKGEKSRGALYHNNHDGTFTDVTDKAGIATPCFAMGGAVGDYNNDGWPDIYVTCFGGNVLYRNNGDGTFTDVTAKAGVAD
jgi:hypothetical protein